MSRTFSRRHLRWHDEPEGLSLRQGRTTLVRLIADERLPGMWRIQTNDGQLSDYVNLTRAKDTAAVIALAQLNVEGSSLEGPPVHSQLAKAA